MPNLILNGTFSSGSANWTGTDIETTYTENAYLGNGSNNSVSEIDGNNSETTVMQQSFNVTGPTNTELTFDTALRTAGDSGIDGFLVEIVDSNNVVIASQSYFPTNTNAMEAATPLAISFPNAGTYTLRFTEIGDNDSLGAIVDNIVIMDCFTKHSLILAKQGLVEAGSLKIGDLVWTKENGFQPIRWIGARKVEVYEQLFDISMVPVEIQKNAIAEGLPNKDMLVSPNHRILLQGWKAELLFGEPEVLVPAKFLVNDCSIRKSNLFSELTYVHFLFDRHEIVEADGLLAESFLPSALSKRGVDRDAQKEIYKLFPDLDPKNVEPFKAANRVLTRHEATLLLANN